MAREMRRGDAGRLHLRRHDRTQHHGVPNFETTIDRGRLQRAVRVANLEQFIDELPVGYNTRLGSAGITLSGGQSQRILIARAVYKEPDFLFFDEATSALDTHNERVIMANLAEFCQGRTGTWSLRIASARCATPTRLSYSITAASSSRAATRSLRNAGGPIFTWYATSSNSV